MTVRTLVAATPGLPLNGGSFLRLEAIDPSTGAAVNGITVSNIVVYGYDVSTNGGGFDLDVIPLLTPEEIDLG